MMDSRTGREIVSPADALPSAPSDSPNGTVHPAAEVDLPLESDPTGGLGATVCSDIPEVS